MNDLLKTLAGEWKGAGLGEYPTITSFEYLETLRITLHGGGEHLFYEQKTRRRSGEQQDYVPSHWESGFIRLLPNNQVEIANAQIGGRVEVMIGTMEETPAGLVLRLRSTHQANDARMEEATRMITVKGDTLHYTMNMRTTKNPNLAMHLEATLQRTK